MSVRMAEIAQRDRPRERLQRLGVMALTDAELLALVLRSGGRDVSAVELAQRLLSEHRGLDGLSRAPADKLVEGYAMGEAKAASLAAALELGRRASAASEPPQARIREPGDIAALIRKEVGEWEREVVLVVVLSRSHRLVCVRRLTVGTDAKCLLEPSDVLQVVLQAGGSAFAVAHTHPSGDVRPSAEDVAVTDRLRKASAAVGIDFVDHLVVSRHGYSVVRLDSQQASG